MTIKARFLLVWFFFSMLFSTAVIADAEYNFLRGFAASKQGDYATAFDRYHQAAEQGYANAQNNLGVMYEKGEGVTQNDQEAVKWYRKAALQGIATSQYNLALMYEKGKGVTQNKQEAVKWYRKAAKQGHAKAQYKLKVMSNAHPKNANVQDKYENGTQNEQQKVINWYHKRAEQGDAEAQYILGLMYDKGYEITENDQEAVKWFRKAAVVYQAHLLIGRFHPPQGQKVVQSFAVIETAFAQKRCLKSRRSSSSQ
ncbi:Sel1 domain protein repeat-containing protein [Candidatus Thiomargarita nelsonii]|uniref:Sel1 domain protein repeat-containing protein n=1 Tax=Candidatus Thiomargarita nelsonii TaxID=1003181 RepID=A0A176RV29_9GAMM|nr:Sel1 domain protein repeat-containing protein [Candidatus Thiomargarita nelsonii]